MSCCTLPSGGRLVVLPLWCVRFRYQTPPFLGPFPLGVVFRYPGRACPLMIISVKAGRVKCVRILVEKYETEAFLTEKWYDNPCSWVYCKSDTLKHVLWSPNKHGVSRCQQIALIGICHRPLKVWLPWTRSRQEYSESAQNSHAQ